MNAVMMTRYLSLELRTHTETYGNPNAVSNYFFILSFVRNTYDLDFKVIDIPILDNMGELSVATEHFFFGC